MMLGLNHPIHADFGGLLLWYETLESSHVYRLNERNRLTCMQSIVNIQVLFIGYE